MSAGPPTFRRPVSFSESHIQLPRITSRERPLIVGSLEDIGLPLEETASSSTLVPSPLGLSPTPLLPPWHQTAHRWAIRFILHIVLISLFETLFFWLFISRTEDDALIGLVSSYTGNLLNACQNLTATQRVAVLDVLNLFINSTATDTAGTAAAADRATFNGILLRNSWLYFGGGVALLATTVGAALWRRLQMRWGQIFAENLVLVLMLGAYEWMFFRTVVLRYQAVSPAELDRMVVDQVESTC